MFTVGRHALGVQAHPEFAAPYLRALLADRIDPIGEAETAAALRSLDRPTDEATVARWILQFIRSTVRGDG
jgi:hypothetical protein